MAEFSILTDDFALAAAEAGLEARKEALAEGHSVIFVDSEGRYVEERPDGRRFEVRLDPNGHGEFHRVVLRELVNPAA